MGRSADWQWDTPYLLSIKKQGERREVRIPSSDTSADIPPSVRELRHWSDGHFMFMHIFILCEVSCACLPKFQIHGID